MLILPTKQYSAYITFCKHRCVLADMGFDLPLPDGKPLEDSIEEPQTYNFLTPLLKQNALWYNDQLSTATNQNKKLSRLSEKISQNLKDIIELIKQRRRRYQYKYPKYDSEDERRVYYDEEFRRNPQYPYRIGHQGILDEHFPVDLLNWQGQHETLPTDRLQEQSTEDEMGDYRNLPPLDTSEKKEIEENTQEVSSEFAYSPFDPRYRQNSSITGMYLLYIYTYF